MPKLPKLKWVDSDWQAKITLKSWAGFHNVLPKGSPYRRDPINKGKVTLTILTGSDERIDVTRPQLKAIDQVINSDSLRHRIIVKAIFDDYPLAEYPELCKMTREELEALQNQKKGGDYLAQSRVRRILDGYLPVIKTPRDLKNLMMLTEVFVHTTAKANLAYVGYFFEAIWDVEHGVGVLMHGNRVVAVGDHDTASVPDHVEDNIEKKPKKKKAKSK